MAFLVCGRHGSSNTADHTARAGGANAAEPGGIKYVADRRAPPRSSRRRRPRPPPDRRNNGGPQPTLARSRTLTPINIIAPAACEIEEQRDTRSPIDSENW